MNNLARSRAFELVGALLVGERSAVVTARTVAPFDQMLSRQHEAELATEHYSVFALGAFPYAGVFTEDEGLVGGRIAQRAIQTLDSMGATEALGNESPDHIGNIFRTIGMLVRRERSDDATDLVRECVLPWIAPWALAVSRQRGGFWPFVVETALALVGELNDGKPPASVSMEAPLMVSETTGVAEVASILTIPARSGAFLAREDIRTLGRRLEYPTGFGSRRLMLTNLLRSAAEYGGGGAVLTALAFFFYEQSTRIHDLCESTAGIPSTVSAHWSQRASETAHSLESMKIELDSTQHAVG